MLLQVEVGGLEHDAEIAGADLLLDAVFLGQHQAGPQVAGPQLLLGRPQLGFRAQVRLDAGQQHREVDRLDHVVVGAVAERHHHVLGLVLGGRHDHRQLEVRVAAADRLEHVDAGQAGHHPVEHHQIGPLAADQVERGGAVVGGQHLVAAAFEAAREQVAVVGGVVDNQDGGWLAIDLVSLGALGYSSLFRGAVKSRPREPSRAPPRPAGRRRAVRAPAPPAFYRRPRDRNPVD